MEVIGVKSNMLRNHKPGKTTDLSGPNTRNTILSTHPYVKTTEKGKVNFSRQSHSI